MTLRTQQAVALGLAITTALVGCSEHPTSPGAGPGGAVISDQAVVLDSNQAILTSDSAARANGRFTFDIVGPLPSVKVGDVIVGAAGGGFLRRVTSVSMAGSTITLQTTSAALTDVVESGSFESVIPLQMGGGGRSARTVSGVRFGPTIAQYLASGVTITNGGLSLDGTVLYNDSVCSTASIRSCAKLSFTIPKGFVAFNPRVALGGHISQFQITEFHAIASGALEFDADVAVTVSGTLDYHTEKTLATFGTPFATAIGVLPVEGYIKLDIVADFSANAILADSLLTGFSGTNSDSLGARYQNPTWASVSQVAHSFTPHPLTWAASGNLDARASVRPQLTVIFYNVAGPFLAAEPYLDLSGSVSPPNWDARLVAGIDGDLGFKVEILSFDLASYSLNIAGPQIVLFDKQGTLSPPTAPSNLVATAVSASQINLTWQADRSNEDGFKIARCTGAGCASFTQIASVGANVTSYQDQGLAAGTSESYRVRAYNAGGTSDYSNTATATTLPPSGPPVKLVFKVQPSNTAAGAAIAPAVQVTAQDTAGNTATGFTGIVTVALGANPGGGTVAGTTSVAAVNGVVTFAALSIDQAGSAYTLVATSGVLARATSASFNIEAFGTVSAGLQHTCGVTTSGAAYCWGVNGSGQLGDGTTTGPQLCWAIFPCSTTPVAVTGALTFLTLRAGGRHNCGVTTRAAAYCWGWNGYGTLGDGTTIERPSPVAVSGGLSFAAVSAGSDDVLGHTCGVTTDGAAYCWGNNSLGQLGDGTTTDRLTPVLVSGGLTFAAVSAGDRHTCGLTTGGAGYCWGYNGGGQLGIGSATGPETCPVVQPCSTKPAAVAGGLTFSAVSAGRNHTCGVTTDGAAYCWGDNRLGQLGDGTTTDRLTPVLVSGGLTLAAVSAGAGHTCGLATGGAGYCWGSNLAGQLGDGTTTDRLAPVPVSGGLRFALVSAGLLTHTCGVASTGAYCWGGADDGDLGNGVYDRPSLVPVRVGP